MQAVANVFRDWKCIQHAIANSCFWLAFLQIQVIQHSCFYILVPEYMQFNNLLQAICKMYAIRFDIHVVKSKR